MEKDCIQNYIEVLRSYIDKDYRQMYRKKGGIFPYGFLTPGSASYGDCLWDWDSYFSNVALKQILVDAGGDFLEAQEYERGCILNFLAFTGSDGYVPIMIARNSKKEELRPEDIRKENMHKPVLAQHAAFLVKQDNGDAEWLRNSFDKLQYYINNYLNHHRHKATGLFYWQTDKMIGVDNDPCTFYRPDGSSASIYLNCLMVKELEAMAYLAGTLGLGDVASCYRKECTKLVEAIREHCYDPRDGFFYSVDINLREVDFSKGEFYHKGMPRHWDCIIQRIDVWSGFMALWAGAATREQAERTVQRYRDTNSFSCAAGVRTLSPQEKMYRVIGSNNPSCWLGPVWIIANYLTFRGLVRYGYLEDAKVLCEKTIYLLGKDIQANGVMHEYYSPEDGMPIINPGFQNWNMLVLNMIYWYEGKTYVEEF